ncbi:hypothetical protein [[Eubacterium] cellulosolvens]
MTLFEKKERARIPKHETTNKELLTELTAIKARMSKLETALEEKDRELRELSILRGEYVQHLNSIRNLLKKAILRPQLIDGLSSRLEQSKLDVVEPELARKAKEDRAQTKLTEKDEKISNEQPESGTVDVVKAIDLDRVDPSAEQTYRERMILMNRIDIYRLFITVIIISGEIKYPRALTPVEERELKMFIEQLNEFENMVLNLNENENTIWEKGKSCEKDILQLFTNFFKV